MKGNGGIFVFSTKSAASVYGGTLYAEKVVFV